MGNRTGEQGTDTNGASTVSRLYSYNARNELTGITDDLTPANSIGYTYDANGNQTGKTQGTLQWTYGYDARDELTGISQTDTSSGSQVTTMVGQYRHDADIGRFLTEDSYEGKQDTPPSLHRYLHAYDNPEVSLIPADTVSGIFGLQGLLREVLLSV